LSIIQTALLWGVTERYCHVNATFIHVTNSSAGGHVYKRGSNVELTLRYIPIYTTYTPRGDNVACKLGKCLAQLD